MLGHKDPQQTFADLEGGNTQLGEDRKQIIRGMNWRSLRSILPLSKLINNFI
jgi:hypothetical protein